LPFYFAGAFFSPHQLLPRHPRQTLGHPLPKLHPFLLSSAPLPCDDFSRTSEYVRSF
jgi:hypothetical protein